MKLQTQPIPSEVLAGIVERVTVLRYARSLAKRDRRIVAIVGLNEDN
jgi:hypothetical protein